MKKINVKRAILENGTLRKEVKFGFSWGAFFLGFIYPLIKEDYMVAGISFVVISIASMIFFPLIFLLFSINCLLDSIKYFKNEEHHKYGYIRATVMFALFLFMLLMSTIGFLNL